MIPVGIKICKLIINQLANELEKDELADVDDDEDDEVVSVVYHNSPTFIITIMGRCASHDAEMELSFAPPVLLRYILFHVILIPHSIYVSIPLFRLGILLFFVIYQFFPQLISKN